MITIKPENINSVRFNFKDSFETTLNSMINSIKKSNFEIEYGIPSVLLLQFDSHYMNRKNDYEKILNFSNEVLEIFPGNISILVLKAESLMKLKKIEESKKILKFVTEELKPYSDMDEFSIGEAYLLLKNNEFAIKYYQKSSESGNLYGIHKLGSLYYTGDPELNIKINRNLAVKYLQKSANSGLAISEYNIGYCYYMGHVFEKDRKIACDWFEKAAKKGYLLAQYKLGSCYLNGVGVEENHLKAREWFQISANQGYPDSIQSLNFMEETENNPNKKESKEEEEMVQLGSPTQTHKIENPKKQNSVIKEMKNWRHSISILKSQSFYKNEKDSPVAVPESPLLSKSKNRESFFKSLKKNQSENGTKTKK